MVEHVALGLAIWFAVSCVVSPFIGLWLYESRIAQFGEDDE